MRVKHDETSEARFGARVRQAREDRGWSQEALARHLRDTAAGVDLHQSAIARLERGERAIRFNEAAALAKVLNIDLRPFAGIDVEPLLTEEDYERVKALAEERRTMEKQVADQLLNLRKQHEDEAAELEQTRMHIAETRWKLDMAIAEYEQSRRG
jgi:transcriptional regulator with XRE-family HTH domain